MTLSRTRFFAKNFGMMFDLVSNQEFLIYHGNAVIALSPDTRLLVSEYRQGIVTIEIRKFRQGHGRGVFQSILRKML